VKLIYALFSQILWNVPRAMNYFKVIWQFVFSDRYTFAAKYVLGSRSETSAHQLEEQDWIRELVGGTGA
jgi:hypothetical protein